jgi:hypothetical protein
MIAFNLAADLIVVAALAWGWGVVAAAFFAVTVVPILKMLFFRADLWSAALTTIAIAAWRRQRDTMVGLLLPVAGALKLWPLPIGLALCWPYGRRRVGVAIARALFIVLTAVLLLYWWSLDGWAGFHQVLTFRNAHGWHDESTVGAVLYFLHPNAHRQEEGASRVGSITGLVSIALMLVAAVFTVAAVWRSARDRRIGTGWVAGIGAMLVCSALFSPQFLVWLLPGAAVAWAEEEKLAPALVAFAVLVTGINRIGDERAWLFLVRNVIVVASTFAASGVLWRQTALTRLASKIQPHAIPQT